MRVCFVGTGSIGRRHIKNLVSIMQDSGEELFIDVLRSSQRELPVDVKSLINREFFSEDELPEEYDAVFITNPTSCHYNTMISLRNLSKFFFVEKPLFDAAEIDIEDMGLSKMAVYYVASPLRFNQVVQKACAIAMKEHVISARAICSSYLPDWRPGVDYRTTYSASKDMGGGVRMDLIHEWDYLKYIFGKPETIYMMHGKYSNLDIDCDDMAVYIARYSDKLVELHLDYFGHNIRRNCEMITDDNNYIFDITNGCVCKNNVMEVQYTQNVNDMYMDEMRYFLDVVNGRKDSDNDLYCALDTLKLV